MADVEQQLTRVLGAWAAGSVVAGAVLVARGETGAGRQHAVWGAVDGAIAVLGAVRRRRNGPTDRRRLRAVLLGNVVLDVGYVTTGVVVHRRRPQWRGDARAVVVQGLFLLALDSWAVRRLRG